MQKIIENSQFHFLKIALKILFSVSVFSFIFSQYSPLFLPLLLRSIDEFSSSFSVNQLFRYNSERNYIFLLCNGILVFIIKNSGLIAMPPTPPSTNPKTGEEKIQLQQEIIKKKEDEERGQEEEEEEEEREKGDEKMVALSDDDDQEEEEENDEVGDGGIGSLSEEEQDKKFDDFIKKMKQEIIMRK